METDRVTLYWKGEYDQVNALWKKENERIAVISEDKIKTINTPSYKDLLAMSAEWEQQWHVQQEEVFTQMEGGDGQGEPGHPGNRWSDHQNNKRKEVSQCAES